MSPKKLRYNLAKLVSEMDEISPSSKLKIIHFIKVTTDEQIQALVNEGAFKSIMGILYSPIGWVAYRAIRSAFSDASRKCGTFSVGKKRSTCLAQVKIDAAKKTIALIGKEARNCNEAKNPSKCRVAIQDQVNKLKAKIAKNQAVIASNRF